MAENTLIGRCTVAYADAVQAIDYPAHTSRAQRAGVASVIEHLAAELVVMSQRNRGTLSAHEAARMLLQEVNG